MSEIQQQRHDALIAHPLEAAERAVAYHLNLLGEGATPELAQAAELLGCRAPGEAAPGGTRRRINGHIDTWRRALPMLARHGVIRLTAPVELVEGGRQHGWLAAGIHDPLPAWEWGEQLMAVKRHPAAWPARFAFARAVMADERVGYTAGADAMMLAAHADSTGVLYARTMAELCELAGSRSRKALSRTLTILQRAGYATVVRDESVRPHLITVHLRGDRAIPSPAPVEAIAAPAAADRDEASDCEPATMSQGNGDPALQAEASVRGQLSPRKWNRLYEWAMTQGAVPLYARAGANGSIEWYRLDGPKGDARCSASPMTPWCWDDELSAIAAQGL